MLMDFTYVSPIVKDICEELHQKTLLPKLSKDILLEYNEKDNSIQVFKKYLFF